MLVLSLAERAQALAVAGGKVYWTRDSENLPHRPPTVGRANVNGTAVKPNFIRPSAHRYDSMSGALAVSDSHIYWGLEGQRSNSGAIGRARLSGRRVQSRLIVRVNPQRLAVYGRNLYWANFVINTIRPKNPSVGRARLNGKRVRRQFIRAGASANRAGIAVGPSGIYWGAGYATKSPTISRANLQGGDINRSFIRLNPTFTSPFIVVHPGRVIGLDEHSIYYTEVEEGSLDDKVVKYRSIDPSAGSYGELISFADEGNNPLSFAVDDSHLYWVKPIGAKRYQIVRAKIIRTASGEFTDERLGRPEVIVDLRTRGARIS